MDKCDTCAVCVLIYDLGGDKMPVRGALPFVSVAFCRRADRSDFLVRDCALQRQMGSSWRSSYVFEEDGIKTTLYKKYGTYRLKYEGI